MEGIFDRLAQGVIAGDLDEVIRLTREAQGQGRGPEEILKEGLFRGMDGVGLRFKEGDMFIPEVLASARAMNAAMEILRPHLTGQGVRSAGTIVIGTVQGDLHDIGKNLVGMMAQGAGFEVIDLGVNQGGEDFCAAVRKYHPQIVALSALLTTTMPEMGKIIGTLQGKGVRGQVRVIVGGAPLNLKFAREIGADGYAPDAITAVETIKELLASG